MKTLIIALLALAFGASAADVTNVTLTPFAIAPQEKASYLSRIVLSPYGTVSFSNFDEGKPRTGWGMELEVKADKTFSIPVFLETDNTGHTVFDRAGLGFRATTLLAKRFHPFAGLSAGYSFETDLPADYANSERWFIRPQFGVGIDLLDNHGVKAELRPWFAFDIWTHGRTDSRLGAALSLSF